MKAFQILNLWLVFGWNTCANISFLIKLQAGAQLCLKQFFCTLLLSETVTGKKYVLRNFENWQENTCARVFFLIKLFIENKTLAQVFSSEFCEISKNTFSTEHLQITSN